MASSRDGHVPELFVVWKETVSGVSPGDPSTSPLWGKMARCQGLSYLNWDSGQNLAKGIRTVSFLFRRQILNIWSARGVPSFSVFPIGPLKFGRWLGSDIPREWTLLHLVYRYTVSLMPSSRRAWDVVTAQGLSGFFLVCNEFSGHLKCLTYLL